MTSYVLSIDQGTTSSRASLFRADTSVAAFAQQEFPQHFPADGEVEHEPEDLWRRTVECCRGAMRKAGATARDIAAIGITNQRETTLLWDRATGRPLHRAIVWQDRRTADLCARLKAAGHEAGSRAKTGLLLDPYFSGTKLAWLLDCAPDIARPGLARRTRLRNGRHLPAVAAHRRQSARHRRHQCVAHAAVRHSSRPLGRRLLALLGVPKAVLPDVRDCSAAFGVTDPALFGGADSDLRHRRRSAGGADRPSLFHAGHGQSRLTAPDASPCSIPARRRSPPTTNS